MTGNSESINGLISLAKQVSEAILEYNNARVISHNDADGITSAAIICQALLRKNIYYHATIVSRLDEKVVENVNNTTSKGDLVIFCDMGSGQPGLISDVSESTVVIDHHSPEGESAAKAVINPHLLNIDGSVYLSASGTAYMVAREMEPSNVDLAGLAVAGAIGDKQLFKSANRFILDEAVQKGIISTKKGLKIGEGDIADLLENTPEPYLDISGDREKIDEFLNSLNIHGNINNLKHEDFKRLASAITLKVIKNASIEAVDSVIGDVYTLNKECVQDIYEYVRILNACGKLKKGGLALTLSLRDSSVLEEAHQMSLEYNRNILDQIKDAEGLIQRGKNIRYLNTEGMDSIGIVAGVVVRYIYPDMPFVATNEVEDVVKVSARATHYLVKKGVDLNHAIREAAKSCGGSGGGHNIASGAAIEKGQVENFINIVDDIIGKQLKSDRESSDEN
ncbi:MAG: DHH family phosphoesterase [Methanohalobium sp.]|uniref:DHH family phosphoesterase n=1 Tax=Methanohalobium sp. TaxID=2837493 RepID=UPI00397DF4A2